MPTDRTALAADLQRLWKLRPEMRPHGLNVDASGNWDDADGRLLPDHIGDGAALMAIMEVMCGETWGVVIESCVKPDDECTGKWSVGFHQDRMHCSESVLHSLVLAALAEATR